MDHVSENDDWVNFADGVWLSTTPVAFMGMRLTSTMSVLRLPDGNLLVTSPVALTPSLRAKVEEQGKVSHLFVPNLMHHHWLAEWAAAFPEARVHGPAGLAKKRPDIHRALVNAESAAALAPTIQEFPIEGFRIEETALLHRPSRTLVLADLVQNVGRPVHRWTAFYARAMGFHDRVAVSRAIRWTAFSDKRAARRSIDRLLDAGFQRLIVGHGAPITTGARDALAAAYAWL